MRKTLVSLLLCASTALVSCTNNKTIVYPVETLSKSSYSGVTQRSELVIDDFANFENLWKETVKNRYPQPPVPEVDFSKYSVVAVYSGQYSSLSGQEDSDLIHGIEEVNGVVEVYRKPRNKDNVQNPTDDPNRPIFHVLTQPYHIVKTNKITKPVKFIH